MPENNKIMTLKQGATVWQLILGLLSTTVVITAFILSIHSDVTAATKDNVRQDKAIDAINDTQKEYAKSAEIRQREIIEKLTEIQLQLKDKADRR